MISIEGDGDGPDCGNALRNMYEFLDNEIDPSKRHHVQSHLDECLPCLESFEFEAELKQVIAKRCKDEVPAELYTKVRMKLVAEIAKQPPEGGIPKA